MCNQSYSKLREINFDDYKERQVPIGISNRHVHVSQADLEKLFGEGYELTPKKDLSQPGQFACEECVDVVGPKGTLAKVR
ncbi:MAG: PduL/EutD family phosphate acyltransferase, partial [Bacillota bacterium]|nr:PduL/EutD family phosphate acyltransferase [Bacillota bacterium]